MQSTFKRTVAVKTLKGTYILCIRLLLRFERPWLEFGHDIFHSCLQCNTGFFDHNEINKMMEESVKMKQFDHPNVMSLIGVCIDAGPAPYIVMPFMVNGSLLSYLRKERPNLLLNETADEDSVSFGLKCCCMLLFNVAAKYLFITI